jgi:hypothetical protein
VVGVFDSSKETQKGKIKSRVKVEVECTPSPVVLKQTPSLRVRVLVSNPAKRAELLEFASSVRADAVVRDSQGQIVARAEAEEAVRQEPGMVTLNPGEKLEYVLTLPTRGLGAGKSYSLEAALVGQEGLFVRSPIRVQ